MTGDCWGNGMEWNDTTRHKTKRNSWDSFFNRMDTVTTKNMGEKMIMRLFYSLEPVLL